MAVVLLEDHLTSNGRHCPPGPTSPDMTFTRRSLLSRPEDEWFSLVPQRERHYMTVRRSNCSEALAYAEGALHLSVDGYSGGLGD